MISFSDLYSQISKSVLDAGGVSYFRLTYQNVHLKLYRASGWSFCSLSTNPGDPLNINWPEFELYFLIGKQLCLRSTNGEYVLFPNQAHSIQIDEYNRIRSQNEKELKWEKTGNGSINLYLNSALNEEVLHLNAVICNNKEEVDQWLELHEVEKTTWAIEGSWSKSIAPAGFFDYWLLGYIYSKRFSDFGRFQSGQDAFSLFRIAALLFQNTQKAFYRFFMQLLAFGLYESQKEDGSWPNGEWMCQPEVHTRFNIDGARLLNQAGMLFNEKRYQKAAKTNLEFFVERADVLENGAIWFLHDACEFEAKEFKKKYKNALMHKAFGKSENNALVLNTHLQTLLLMAEMQEIFADEEVAKWEQMGLDALEMVLRARPSKFQYTIADFLLQQILSIDKAGLSTRILRRYGFKHLYKIYRLQKHPRFISPAGFLFRDVALPLHGYWYHFVNIYDIQQLYVYRPQSYLREVLDKSLSYPGNKGLATFLLHYHHYLAPQWWQILHLAKRDSKAYVESLQKVGYGVPPETQLEEGLFTTEFWKKLKDIMF